MLIYTAGRFWIEALRIDTVNEIGGFRLNNYTSLILFLAALIWFIWLVRNRPGREEVVEGPDPEPEPAAEAMDDKASTSPEQSENSTEGELSATAAASDPERSTKDDF